MLACDIVSLCPVFEWNTDPECWTLARAHIAKGVTISAGDLRIQSAHKDSKRRQLHKHRPTGANVGDILMKQPAA